MGGLIPDSFIDELLARVDIVDVIERRVPLKKAGKRVDGMLPVPQRALALVLGQPGQAVLPLLRLRRPRQRHQVPDGVRPSGVPRRGRRAGANRGPARCRARPAGMRPHARTRPTCTRCWTPPRAGMPVSCRAAPRPRRIAANAGWTRRPIARFRLGWAPGGFDGVIKALGHDERRLQLLTEAGMVASNERGSNYDRFRERLMFPILDRRGRVIAFGGRILQEKPPHASAQTDTAEPPAAQGHRPNTSIRPRHRCSTKVASCLRCGR